VTVTSGLSTLSLTRHDKFGAGASHVVADRRIDGVQFATDVVDLNGAPLP
jgi:hypothetical protein